MFGTKRIPELKSINICNYCHLNVAETKVIYDFITSLDIGKPDLLQPSRECF